MSPLVQFPDKTITLPLQYFGSVGYYARMAAFGRVVLDDMARYDKRFKSAHRCTIADTHGLLQLTVPVAKPKPQSSGGFGKSQNLYPAEKRILTWRDILISDHGQWWQDVDVSIASAYGRTPFYEFYIDRLRRFFAKTTPTSFDSVASLDVALNAVICEILGIDSEIVLKSAYAGDNLDRFESSEKGESNPDIPKISESYIDSHNILDPKPDIPKISTVEYYQVRRGQFGFIPDLSILDLIFNMGPESPLILRKMATL